MTIALKPKFAMRAILFSQLSVELQEIFTHHINTPDLK